MKFTDGNWLHLPGVTPNYATEVYDHAIEPNTISMVVPCHSINHRGDTLGGANLTITLSSPLEDVVSIKIVHFDGVNAKIPSFEVADFMPSVSTKVEEGHLALTSGKLTARISKKNYKLEFLDGERVITTSPTRGAAYMEVADQGAFVLDKLTLSVGELIYGLGERFTSFTKNGQVVDIWNEDGGTCSNQAYKNIPFYMTNKGYGVFVNHTGRVSFEVATERTSRVQFSVPGESLEYFVIYGPTPKEVLDKYTRLTGRPALPPAWSFGLWLSTSFTTDYDEKTVNEFIQGMEDRDIPLTVFHYDCYWMRGFRWCDFEWDPNVFPDPAGMLARLHDRGLRVCAWINPYIAQASSLFAVGKEKGYFLKKTNGDVWQWDMWQPGMAIVDFTNPEATKWYKGLLGNLLDQGVDALKTDFGERIPTDVVYHDGSDPVMMHNLYTQQYNKAVFELLEEKRGVGEAVLFARSATVGGQMYPVHWGGDCWSDFEAMAESLRGGLSLCLSGFGFWSHDIGGFEGLPPADLYKRWVAFGLLSSHSRLHGSTSYRVPWVYDEEAVSVLRFFTRFKHRLMPYLWAAAVWAHQTGTPVMRAMHLEFPDDPACDTLDRQYMLGDALLVAPVFSFDGTVDYYVPAGQWTNLLNGSIVEGGRWIREKHDTLSLPVLARHGYQIPVSLSDETVEAAFDGEIGVLDFGGDLPATFDLQGKPWSQTLTPLTTVEFLQWVRRVARP
jgi:alpha-D-xyloside xylohydrolase